MTQKEIFEKLYSMVLTRGIDGTLDLLNCMYDSFEKNDAPGSGFKNEDAKKFKDELVDLFEDTQRYRDELFQRGMTEVDRSFFSRQKISKELLIQDLSQVEREDTIFYDKRVVLTGIFSKYPVRDFLADILKKLGADINSSISKKTDIVCVGEGPGPAKLAKIDKLLIEGYDIKVITQNELYSIIDKI